MKQVRPRTLPSHTRRTSQFKQVISQILTLEKVIPLMYCKLCLENIHCYQPKSAPAIGVTAVCYTSMTSMTLNMNVESLDNFSHFIVSDQYTVIDMRINRGTKKKFQSVKIAASRLQPDADSNHVKQQRSRWNCY